MHGNLLSLETLNHTQRAADSSFADGNLVIYQSLVWFQLAASLLNRKNSVAMRLYLKNMLNFVLSLEFPSEFSSLTICYVVNERRNWNLSTICWQLGKYESQHLFDSPSSIDWISILVCLLITVTLLIDWNCFFVSTMMTIQSIASAIFCHSNGN